MLTNKEIEKIILQTKQGKMDNNILEELIINLSKNNLEFDSDENYDKNTEKSNEIKAVKDLFKIIQKKVLESDIKIINFNTNIISKGDPGFEEQK